MGDSLHKQLWRQNQDLAVACLQHPFVRGLADGRLAPQAFRRYVAQDAFFLQTFARAYALAAARSPDLATLNEFSDLLQATFEELRLHEGYSQRLGIDQTAVRPFRATTAYTDFLLATAWHMGLAETVAAMTPCMRLYGYLGGQLAREVSEPSLTAHPYRDWIETYSGAEFQASAGRLESLLDRLASQSPPVQQAYRYAMQCELHFFSAPLETES
ncbi:MAG: TenA family protein [Acidobacteria bacterium]|nr:TenA family protein [Acidobacteriota bacterium]